MREQLGKAVTPQLIEAVEPGTKALIYQPALLRCLAKAGHTHGLPFALYNLIIGLLVDRMQLGDRGKRWLSWLAVVALVMPVGLMARALDGGGMTFAPMGLIGGVSFIASAVILLIGAARL